MISKTLGFGHLVKYQWFYDVVFTFGIPCLFFGTYHGTAIAILAGIEFSLFAWVAKLIRK